MVLIMELKKIDDNTVEETITRKRLWTKEQIEERDVRVDEEKEKTTALLNVLK